MIEKLPANLGEMIAAEELKIDYNFIESKIFGGEDIVCVSVAFEELCHFEKEKLVIFEELFSVF